MMTILITFLTVVLVLNCILLILLVLIQLPKKEAGAGLAFGGGTTDALFGAGSGNALTQITKYAAASFLIMSVFLGVLNTRAANSSTSRIRRELANQKLPPAAPATAPAAPVNQFQSLLSTNMLAAPANAGTNAPATASTNTARPVVNTNAAAPASTNK